MCTSGDASRRDCSEAIAAEAFAACDDRRVVRLLDLPLPLCRLRLLPPIKRGLRERERGVRVWLLAWLWLLLLLYTSFAASSASLACCICSCSASSCRTFLMCAMLGSSIFVSLPFSSSWYLCRAGRREGGG